METERSINRRQLFPSTPYIKARSVCPQCCTCCVRFASRGFIHIFNRLRRCFAPLFLSSSAEDSVAFTRPIDYSYTRGNHETRVANKNQQFSIEGIEHVPKHARRCNAVIHRIYERRDIFISFVAYLPFGWINISSTLADDSCFSSSSSFSSSKYNVK